MKRILLEYIKHRTDQSNELNRSSMRNRKKGEYEKMGKDRIEVLTGLYNKTSNKRNILKDRELGILFLLIC